MNFRSYADLDRIISQNIDRIPQNVDLIVGVPKSGLLVASMIALYLNLPLADIDLMLKDKLFESGISKRRNNWIKKPSEARKILVVDDSSATGITFSQTKEKLIKSKFSDKIILLIVFVNETTMNLPDMYFDICPSPRMFEWNIMHHGLLSNACCEIDGVLCRKPSVAENSEEKSYENFINTVNPRIIPTKKIKYIVTSRLEKYRNQTEKWLEKNKIQYDNLIMLDYLSNNISFKAEKFKELDDSMIFIENNPDEAEIIRNTSNKPVFCTGNCKFYPSFENNGELEKKDRKNILEQETKCHKSKEKIIVRIRRNVIPYKIRKKIKSILTR